MLWFEVSRTKEEEGGKEAGDGGKEAGEGGKEAVGGAKEEARTVMCTSGASLAREGSVDMLSIRMIGSYWRRWQIRRLAALIPSHLVNICNTGTEKYCRIYDKIWHKNRCKPNPS